jgi:hypothetical protein
MFSLSDFYYTDTRKNTMPLYMDIHHKVDGLTASAVMRVHEADVQTQEKYGVQYVKYWFDESSGKVFCLVQAPNKEAAAPCNLADTAYVCSQRSSLFSDVIPGVPLSVSVLSLAYGWVVTKLHR